MPEIVEYAGQVAKRPVTPWIEGAMLPGNCTKAASGYFRTVFEFGCSAIGSNMKQMIMYALCWHQNGDYTNNANVNLTQN